jgi:hypothetical protein
VILKDFCFTTTSFGRNDKSSRKFEKIRKIHSWFDRSTGSRLTTNGFLPSRLLHKPQKAAFFMYRAATKAHQISLDFVPNHDFRVYTTDSIGIFFLRFPSNFPTVDLFS